MLILELADQKRTSGHDLAVTSDCLSLQQIGGLSRRTSGRVPLPVGPRRVCTPTSRLAWPFPLKKHKSLDLSRDIVRLNLALYAQDYPSFGKGRSLEGSKSNGTDGTEDCLLAIGKAARSEATLQADPAFLLLFKLIVNVLVLSKLQLLAIFTCSVVLY